MKRVAQVCLIVVVVWLVQLPALSGGFIWDDSNMIPGNPMIAGGLRQFWTSTEQPDYWPVAYTTHWLEWRIWGRWAPGYRALNNWLHALNAIFIWIILSRLQVPAPWFCGLLFAVHPVTVEAIAWILQRKTVLSTAWALAALWCFLQYGASHRRRWYAIAIGAFLLALLTKSSVVMWPFVLLICQWWQRRSLTSRDFRLALPFFVVSLAMGLVGLWFQYYRAIGPEIVRGDGFWSRLALAGWAVWFYVGKALFPRNLSFIYPRWELGVNGFTMFLPSLLLLVLFVAFWRYRTSWGAPWLAGMGYYVLNLVPVMGFANIYFMRYSLVADHWQYLSLPGLIALVVGGGTYALTATSHVPSRIRVGLATIMLALLAMRSWTQAQIYRSDDNEVLWRDTIAKNPNSVLAHNNLGFVLNEKGRHEEAIDCYRQALRLVAGDAGAHTNWGVALAAQGKLIEAIRHYQRALEINPHEANAYYNLAVTLGDMGRLEEAIEAYHQAVRLKPGYVDAHYNLGILLADRGRFDEAIDHYRRALAIQPESIKVRDNLGDALRRSGQLEAAIGEWTESLRRNPENFVAHYQLGAALVEAGRLTEGTRHLTEAVRLAPDLIAAHRALADAYLLQGRLRDAEPHLRQLAPHRSGKP